MAPLHVQFEEYKKRKETVETALYCPHKYEVKKIIIF